MSNAQAMSEPAATPVTLKLTRRFAAPRDAVFRAWTDPEELAKWFGPPGVSTRGVTVDLRPGGGYSLEMLETDGKIHALSGVYQEVQPPERLVYTWVWGTGEIAGVEMLVTVQFAEAGDETEITLVHERLPSDTARHHHQMGWTGCLDSLDEFLKG